MPAQRVRLQGNRLYWPGAGCLQAATSVLMLGLLLGFSSPVLASRQLLLPEEFPSSLLLRPEAAGSDISGGQAAPPAGKTYYIFGYGSLLNRQSTQKTDCGLAGVAEGTLAALEALFLLAKDTRVSDALKACEVRNPRAVRVAGLRRGFFVPGRLDAALGFPPLHPWKESAFLPGFCPLGAVLDEDDVTTTGIVYEVDEAGYNATRRREGGYLVKELDHSAITVLGGPPLPEGARVTAFAFPSGELQWPSWKLPLSSSYIDVWLSGALDLQSEFNLTGEGYLQASGGRYSSFVEETIKTTEGWSRYWVNDRAVPLRSFVMSPEAWKVDAALWEWAPHEALQGMRFPGQPWEEEEEEE